MIFFKLPENPTLYQMREKSRGNESMDNIHSRSIAIHIKQKSICAMQLDEGMPTTKSDVASLFLDASRRARRTT